MSPTLQEYIEALYRNDPDSTIPFRIFPDRKGDIFTGTKLDIPLGQLDSVVPKLQKHNNQNRCIAAVVNSGGHSDRDITRINAQFVEMDEGTFEEQQAKIDAFPLPPSIVNQTKKSLHVFWLTDNSAVVKNFRPIQEALVKWFAGDPCCVNESRAMRLPGFYHCKTDTRVMVRCISFHPERRYSQSELIEILAVDTQSNVPRDCTAPATEATEQKSEPAKALDAIMYGCAFIQHCKACANTLSEPLWHAMIAVLAKVKGGKQLIHQLSAPYPAYTEEATEKKIDHFLKSGTNPMTCQAIHDLGFSCPLFESGECHVKSPAGLAYRPMSVSALSKVIDALPVSRDMAIDVQTAKKFVEAYLYDLDTVDAEILIQDRLRRHFDLSNNFVCTLRNHYKQIRKERTRKSLIDAPDNEDIPEWYEPGFNRLRFCPGLLAEHLAATEHTFYTSARFFAYDNGVYKAISDTCAQRIVMDHMLSRERTSAQIEDATKQWILMIQKHDSELNRDPYIINVKNGLLDVRNGTISAHSPECLSTIQLNATYDTNAECPTFMRFLHEAFPEDPDQIGLIQEILGYFLVPLTLAQKCFVIQGAAGSGKSVLLLVVNEILLSPELVSNVSLQALNERFKTAELYGKLANIFADLPSQKIEDTGIFKALVGGDYLTVEKKNQPPFSFKSKARLLFSCNDLPMNVGDLSDGFYRRLIIIHFAHPISGDKLDPSFLEKLRAEADGIFLFAFEGLRRLIRNNFKFNETETNRKMLQQYRAASDPVLSFINENCRQDPSYSVGSTELWNSFKSYCKEYGFSYRSQKAFVSHLMELCPNIKKERDPRGQKRILVGITTDAAQG